MKKQGKFTIKFIAYTGMMTAIVYVATLIGVSTPVANFNIGDSAILITAALFNPVTAMIAGGLGAFLADLTTYPVTMLYTLVIKAIEGLLAGIAFTLIYKWFDKKENPTKRDVALKIVFGDNHVHRMHDAHGGGLLHLQSVYVRHARIGVDVTSQKRCASGCFNAYRSACFVRRAP